MLFFFLQHQQNSEFFNINYKFKMSNTFFQRNTISNWAQVQPQREGLSKVRAKRAQSVAEIKINPSKFQHRQVFDSTIYQKVNFFRSSLGDLNKQQKPKQFEQLFQTSKQLSSVLGDKNIANFSKNYCNMWSLIPETEQKNNVLTTMTESLNLFLKNILSKTIKILKSKEQSEQQLMRTQVDLKLTRKDFSRTSEVESKQPDRREEKQKDKKMKEKIMCLDFELKKEKLKSQQLQQQIIEQGRIITDLENQNKALKKEKQQQSTYKQSMEFKIKRMKEELQVAHIIKEQNLADKMKYIMNW